MVRLVVNALGECEDRGPGQAARAFVGHQDCRRGYYRPAVEPLLRVGGDRDLPGGVRRTSNCYGSAAEGRHGQLAGKRVFCTTQLRLDVERW